MVRMNPVFSVHNFRKIAVGRAYQLAHERGVSPFMSFASNCAPHPAAAESLLHLQMLRPYAWCLTLGSAIAHEASRLDVRFREAIRVGSMCQQHSHHQVST